MKSVEFVRALIAGLMVLAMEILLLSILIPIAIRMMRAVRTRRMRVSVDFYLFQIFHKIVRLFLSIASVHDVLPILREEQQRNPEFEIGSNPVYGNLSNLLFVLNKVFQERDRFKKALERKTLADFQRYLTVCDRSMDEVDRLVSMLSNLPNVQSEIFKTRLLVYVLRDRIQDAIDEIAGSEKPPVSLALCAVELQECAEMVTKAIEATFRKRKKLPDGVLRQRYIAWVARLLITAPLVRGRHWVAVRWCRFRNKPHEDPYHPCRTYLVEWRTKYGFTLQEAARVLGLSEADYRDFEYAYREPSLKQWHSAITKHLRGEIDYSKFRDTHSGPLPSS